MRNTCVTLDITPSEIRVLAMENGKISKWKSDPLPEGLLKLGTIIEQQAVSVIIDNLFRSLNLNRKRVICCVTGLPFTYRTINMPGLGKEVPNEAIERAARKEMSLSEEDIFLAWQMIEEHVEIKETDYFVIGVPKTSLNPVLNTLSMAGIKPASIDIKPLALARGCSSPNSLIVSVEKNNYDIVFISNGLPRVIHSFSPSRGSEDDQSIVTELVDGLNKAVKSFYREFPQNTLPADTPILLSGEFSSDELLHLIQESTGHPTSFPKAQIEIPVDLSMRLYTTNLGLALKISPHETSSSQYKYLNINLLENVFKKPKREFKVSYAVAGILFILLFAAVYYTYDLKEKSSARLDGLQRESLAILGKLEAAQNASKETQNTYRTKLTELQNINTQLDKKKNEEIQIDDFKRDFAFRIAYILDKLPEGVEYKTIDMQTTQIKITGLIEYPQDLTQKYKNPIGQIVFAESVAQNDVFSKAQVISVAPSSDVSKASFVVIITE